MECCVCGDGTTPPPVTCHNGHRTCLGCLTAWVRASLEPSKLRHQKGRIRSPGIEGGNTTPCTSLGWSEEELCHVLPATLMGEYFAAVRGLLGLVLGEQREEDHYHHPLRATVLDALNEKCPGCSQVFVDHEGCDAVTCPRCGVHFCVVCLHVPATARAAHLHVKSTHGAMYNNSTSHARDARQRHRIAEMLLQFPTEQMEIERILRELGKGGLLTAPDVERPPRSVTRLLSLLVQSLQQHGAMDPSLVRTTLRYAPPAKQSLARDG